MLWKVAGMVFLASSIAVVVWLMGTNTLYKDYGQVVLGSLAAHLACSVAGERILQATMGSKRWSDMIDEDKGGHKSMHYRATNTLGSFMHAAISGTLTVIVYTTYPRLLLEFWKPQFYASSEPCPLVAFSAAVTLGYLIVDTWHTVYHGYAPVKVPIIVHHVCMSTGVSLMIYYDVAMPYLAMGLACELQSSFMHLWWLMAAHGWHLGQTLPQLVWVLMAVAYVFTRYAAHAIMSYTAFTAHGIWGPVLREHGAPEALGWMAAVAFGGFSYLNFVLHLDLWKRFKRDRKEAEFLMRVEQAGEDARKQMWERKWQQLKEKREQRKAAKGSAARTGTGGKGEERSKKTE